MKGGVAVSRYASETTVPVERSRAEIEQTLVRYGASEFQSGWTADMAMIGFRIRDLSVRIALPIPRRDEPRFLWRIVRKVRVRSTEKQAEAGWQQEVRQRWRALGLVVKAKLEAVECRISTLEEEFLAFIVMPDRRTIGEWFVKEALPAMVANRMPALPAASTPTEGRHEE
jgi:hypothetical protein